MFLARIARTGVRVGEREVPFFPTPAGARRHRTHQEHHYPRRLAAGRRSCARGRSEAPFMQESGEGTGE